MKNEPWMQEETLPPISVHPREPQGNPTDALRVTDPPIGIFRSSVNILHPKVPLFLLEYSMYPPEFAVLEANAAREQEGVLHQDIPNAGLASVVF